MWRVIVLAARREILFVALLLLALAAGCAMSVLAWHVFGGMP